MKDSSVGKRLKLAMEFRGLRAKDIVENVNITKGAFSCYLNDKYIPKDNVLSSIADYLNISKDWLNGNGNSMETIENKVRYLSFNELEEEIKEDKYLFLKLLDTIDLIDLLYGNKEYFEFSKKHIEGLIENIKSIGINRLNNILSEEKYRKQYFFIKNELIKSYLKEICKKDEFISELNNRNVFYGKKV